MPVDRLIGTCGQVGPICIQVLILQGMQNMGTGAACIRKPELRLSISIGKSSYADWRSDITE